MTSLDILVSQVVDSYRSVFKIISIIAIAFFVYQQNWLGLILLGPLLISLYFSGLWLTGQILSLVVSKDLLLNEFQSNLIQTLNDKLKSGEMSIDDPEFAKEMERAGLRPLSVIVEKGPIFGRQHDANLHEWIDAKEGDAGVGRYLYQGQASFDVDGTVFIQNQDTNNLFLVLDGFLYERVMKAST